MQNLYSNLNLFSKKLKGHLLADNDELSLKSLYEKKDINVEDIEYAYINDLQRILEMSEIENIIVNMFELESNLENLVQKFSEENILPTLTNFYADLSPLLLQIILERGEAEESVMKGWLEAIRIAIEKEIYIWQEKKI